MKSALYNVVSLFRSGQGHWLRGFHLQVSSILSGMTRRCGDENIEVISVGKKCLPDQLFRYFYVKWRNFKFIFKSQKKMAQKSFKAFLILLWSLLKKKYGNIFSAISSLKIWSGIWGLLVVNEVMMDPDSMKTLSCRTKMRGEISFLWLFWSDLIGVWT